MRNFLILPFLFFAFLSMTACSPYQEEPTIPETPEHTENNGNDSTDDNDNENDENMETNTLKLTVNGRTFTATLVDNSSTKALKERLAQGSVSIRMDDYGNMEKVGSLGFTLPQNNSRITTAPGDLILYQDSSFVIYYDTNVWSLTRLGKVDGVTTRQQMLDLLGGSGSVTVTLSLE